MPFIPQPPSVKFLGLNGNSTDSVLPNVDGVCKSRLENIEFLYMIDEENTDFQANRQEKKKLIRWPRGFPGGAVVENPPANAGDTGSSPGLGRSHMPRSN